MKLKNKKFIFNGNLLIVTSYLGIKLFGTFFAIYIFGKFTPLVDSLNYINNFYINNLTIGDVHPLRTSVIQTITTFLVGITRSEFMPHLFYSFLSGIGILIYSIKTKKPLILFLLLLPSSLVWTSITGKEAIFFSSISLLLLIWIKMISKKMKLQDWLILIVLLIFCCFFRPHYTIGFIWLLLSAFIINLEKKYTLLIIFLCLFITSVIFLCNTFLISKAFTSIDPFARASRFSMFNLDYTFNSLNIEHFKKYIFIGFIFGIIGPFPSEIMTRIEFVPFFIEGIVILTSPLIFIYLMSKDNNLNNKKKYIENFYLGVIPAIIILMYLHAPFGILNPGSAIRWRVNFELIFYFAPLLLYLEYMRND